jgi:short-subunit dehydrogenase
MQLQGKVVVITGASMGIGESVAQTFAAEGASVVLCSRDLGRAEAARERIGFSDRTLAVACDVREREQIAQLIRTTMVRFGRIDVWINNAGHGLNASVASMEMTACREMFETNLFGAVECMQAVIPVMKQQSSGTIVNISSVAGHIPVPGKAAYSATKFAMNAISKAARVELKPLGVHVMTVCPGYIRTEFSARAVKGPGAVDFTDAVRGRIGPERVARAVLLGYLAKKREVVVPATDRWKIKAYQLFPSAIEWFMAKILKPVN